MEMFIKTSPFFSFLVIILFYFFQYFSFVSSIGVNYGTLGNNLPPPSQVAQFIKNRTIINKIKIFDMNPNIISAFANTGISVTVTVPNGEIPKILDIDYAKNYVETNIKPFIPQTKIDIIAIGNEVLLLEEPKIYMKLVQAMRIFYQALIQCGINTIKVSTPNALGILSKSDYPSMAKFRSEWDNSILIPMLQFLRETNGPFMVNPYPYFDYNQTQLDFYLFRKNKGIFDRITKKLYTNMFDMILDSIYISMKKIGYEDVEIIASETGWSSLGENFEKKCSLENAISYNRGLIRKYFSREGTPLMPNKQIEIYIFGLFNENSKKGSIAERNFGLFRPDFTPVYNIGIMKGETLPLPLPMPPKGLPKPPQPGPSKPIKPGPRLSAHQFPMGRKFCMPKAEATDAQLQANLNWACNNQSVDCDPVQAGGPCFSPNTVRSHAGFVMNSYYQIKGKNDFNCDFLGSGIILFADPSLNFEIRV